MMVPILFHSEEHVPCLEEDTVIWRYMDLPRFLDLLAHKTLHFSSKLQFKDDPWEGTVPEPVIKKFASRFGQEGWGHLIEQFKYVTARACVHCWFERQHQSVHMWDRYAREGIAVMTTVHALRKSLNLDSEHLRIARIKYGQHSQYDSGNSGYSALAPLLFKRDGYEDEREVRAIVLPADESPSGIDYPVDLTLLIEEVFVSPQYPRWAVPGLSKVILDWAGLSVNQSTLLDKPPESDTTT